MSQAATSASITGWLGPRKIRRREPRARSEASRAASAGWSANRRALRNQTRALAMRDPVSGGQVASAGGGIRAHVVARDAFVELDQHFVGNGTGGGGDLLDPDLLVALAADQHHLV